MNSEDYIKQELEKEQKIRTITKYRLFGRDGVTDQELEKLKKDWKIIPINPDTDFHRSKKNAQKKKKRITRLKYNNELERQEEYSTDMSGNSSECYETVFVEMDPYIYNDNEAFDQIKFNKGFKLQPLE